MTYSLSSFCTLNHSFSCHKPTKYPKITCQTFSDNEKRANIVDSNLRILRERIEQVQKRELIHRVGWNYKHGYEHNYKKDTMMSQSAEIIGLACSAIGLVFLVGSLSIFLLSLFLMCI
ncbi:hypothetical protein PHAVU_007G035600 [Phaseolus vulgaris]|uniref:Uncharacterized protein n=1 Tax=Phaseolus vulgaris TaxID=3885 RepID=V7BAZ8_PHAVU|nr:hypothetical protein PHAVU_007G035600g [Phaseolus vulgaris]ESW14999.1 hypothetical protein PHAVU_007G035600g [Phaseolus vulgaris]